MLMTTTTTKMVVWNRRSRRRYHRTYYWSGPPHRAPQTLRPSLRPAYPARLASPTLPSPRSPSVDAPRHGIALCCRTPCTRTRKVAVSSLLHHGLRHKTPPPKHHPRRPHSVHWPPSPAPQPRPPSLGHRSLRRPKRRRRSWGACQGSSRGMR